MQLEDKDIMGLLKELAAQVSAHAKTIEDTLEEKNLPLPSFQVDSPTDLPDGPEYRQLQEARNALIDAARSLEHLGKGPEQWMKSQHMTVRATNSSYYQIRVNMLRI